MPDNFWGLLAWILVAHFADRDRRAPVGLLTQLQSLFGPKPRTHP